MGQRDLLKETEKKPPELHTLVFNLLSKKKQLARLPSGNFTLDCHNLIIHKTRSVPSFISSACAVDLSKRDWKSVPPCSQAILMADFILSAKTMNLDGRRIVMGTKAYDVDLSHSGPKS
jgi:hypothetical protein